MPRVSDRRHRRPNGAGGRCVCAITISDSWDPRILCTPDGRGGSLRLGQAGLGASSGGQRRRRGSRRWLACRAWRVDRPLTDPPVGRHGMAIMPYSAKSFRRSSPVLLILHPSRPSSLFSPSRVYQPHIGHLFRFLRTFFCAFLSSLPDISWIVNLSIIRCILSFI